MRVRVWKEAAVGTPRIIKLRLNKDVGLRGKGWSSSTKVPGLLHACREARYEGLKTYELHFPLEQNNATIGPPRIYFNPQLDTLYLDKSAVESSRGHWQPDRQALATVQHLAVQTDVWTIGEDNGNRYHVNPFSLGSLARFCEMKTLTLVRDITTIQEHKREKAKGPVQLRQRFTDEKKLLDRVKEQLATMAEMDIIKFSKDVEYHLTHTPSANAPVFKYTTTPAVRLLEYQERGAEYKNGAKGYDDRGKWKGYGRGSFVRLGRGWQWIVPEQQWKDENGEISEDKKFAMDVAVRAWK